MTYGSESECATHDTTEPHMHAELVYTTSIRQSHEDFFAYSNVKITRGNSFKIIVQNSRVGLSDAGADFFSVRIITIWNCH